MKQFLQVFKFEFAGFVKGKWFRVSTIIISLLVVVVLFVPRFMNINDGNTSEDVSKTTDRIGLYDPSGVFENDTVLKTAFPKAKFVKEDSVEKLKSAIKKDTLDVGFYVKDASNYEYLVMDSSMEDKREYVFASVMNIQHQTATFNELGLNQKQVEKILTSKVNSKTTILGKDGKQNFLYTYILIFVLYMVLMFYGQMTATNVASEKGNRSMEILVTSTSSNALIFGKVLAGAAASIVQVTIILGLSVLAYQMNVDAWNHMLDFLFDIPVSVIAIFAIFGTLGYLFYSFIYGALGSMVSKVEEVSAAITPIMIIFMISFFITFMTVMREPDSLLSAIASYVPFTSCMAMFARAALGSVDMWQVALSALVLLVSTIAVGVLGAKLYRHGTLSYGNSFKMKHLLKVLKRKE